MAFEDTALSRTHLQRRLSQAMVLVFLFDTLVLLLASSLAWALRTRVDDLWWKSTTDAGVPPLGTWLVLIWLVVLLATGAYQSSRFAAGFEEFRAIGLGSLVGFGLVGSAGFLSHSLASRGYIVLFFVIGTPLLLAIRYADRKVLHRLRAGGRMVNRVIAVGSVAAVNELVAVLDREPWTGYRVVGMCLAGPSLGEPRVPILGAIDDVRSVVVANGASSLLVAGGSYSSSADLRRLGWDLEGLDLDLLVVPSLTDVAGPRVHFRHLAGLPLVHVREPQIAEASGLAKRAFDLVVTLGLLVLLAVPMGVIALIIRLQDGGPALYRQRRVGRHSSEFAMIKFRSMRVDADSERADLAISNESDGVLFKIRQDPRVTRFGRFMRKFSLDELPQLFNVLAGEMSLVGPRPPLPSEVASYEDHVNRRLLVRPGMTGLWQVSGRSDLSWDESVRLDLYYVDNWSLMSDLAILLKTIRAVLLGRGAY